MTPDAKTPLSFSVAGENGADARSTGSIGYSFADPLRVPQRADLARLDAILSALAPADAAFVSALTEAPWRTRERRLSARDAAIRRALELLSREPNPAARLATLMAQQAGQRWGGTVGNHLVVAATREVLALNDGAAMTERHIRRIAGGARTPGT